MSESTDPYLDLLGDQWIAARRAEVPDLREVRATRRRFVKYLAECVLEEMESWNDYVVPASTGPRLRVITNDGPVRHNPRRMSSPVKTDAVRGFEARVNRVFGTDASAMMEWPTG